MNKIIDFPNTQIEAKTPEELSLQERRKEAISKLPRYRGNVQSKTSIRSLPDVEAGQIFWVDMDNKAYIVAEKDRKKMTIKALDETATVSTGMTIYDMNKNIISKEPVFDWDDGEGIAALNDRMVEWFAEDTNNTFYLLYGRDIHYVSLLQKGEAEEPLLDIIKDTLSAVGELISMDFNTSDGEPSIEIWIRTDTSAAELLYLFPYDKGVVTI